MFARPRTKPSKPFHKPAGKSGALRIQPGSGLSERRADAFARAITGRSPESNGHASPQSSHAPVHVGQLIDSELGDASNVRRVPGDLRSTLGPAADRIRLHTGEAAGIAARSIGAQAFAVGEDVFFAPDKFQPEKVSGRSLIAHELAHAVEGGGGDRIARTPGVPYPDEQTAAREAFKYLLSEHPDKLEQEWGGYIYRMPDEAGAESYFHSVPRTDAASGSVTPTTEKYARAEVEDAQEQWDRQAARAQTPPDPSSRPANFRPTLGWMEPQDIQRRGGTLTATYHNHPKLGHAGNKASGQSTVENQPSAGDPYAPKWTGDIPTAHRSGLTSYMVDLDKPTGGKGLGYDLDRYVPNKVFPGLDDIVGIEPTVGNEFRCQWGFAPETGTKSCEGVAPSQSAIEAAARLVKSRSFAVAVELGDIPRGICLQMIKAADMADETVRCGVDPRSPEQQKVDERRGIEAMFQKLADHGIQAHDFLTAEDEHMRMPR